ncbi:hypothetical protein E7744_00715 [Citricoccus sp. SGAir0253]|uniref:hypothetical protein n=1 Tax=Citricoccus sp. SGAir0253 TaxID=2567881 RepID=UPI0010CCD2D4|nr:hypothetical protein [Citricoccus sp. SGAir0253]QCU76916.1 hypothetical protein E7744_00715 [Citricoccus sp. SGAir0253]
MDAEANSDDPALVPMVIGPFLIDVPGEWEIVDLPDERVTVIREPRAPDDPLLAIPGFVTPNVALRFFEAPSAEGGAAKAAAREAAATYDQVPGSVLLAISPFMTREGLPGRAHVMAGIHEGIPFQSARWFAGDGAFVIEITLIGPATPLGGLVELGQRMADSIRPTAEGRGDITPLIPEDLQDRAMMDGLGVPARAETARAPGLERVDPILAARPLLRPVPETVPLCPEAWSSLLELAHGGIRGRLMGATRSTPHPELVQAGLATERRLTDAGRAWATLGGFPVALTLHGARADGERYGEIRLDGMDCLVTLDQPFPTDRALTPTGSGSRLVGALLTLALPTVLLDWSGARADWFTDLRATGPARHFVPGRASVEDASSWSVESGDVIAAEVLAGQGTRWTAALATGEPRVSWYQPDGRGPLMVAPSTDGTVRLESTTGLALYETLSRLIRDVARYPADTVVP